MNDTEMVLAPGEIVVDGFKRQLIDGCPHWNYREHRSISGKSMEVTIYYKQHPVGYLRKLKRGGFLGRLSTEGHYMSLAAFVEAHKDSYSVQWTEAHNQKHGITQWYEQSATEVTVKVTLALAEMQQLEQLAQSHDTTKEALAARAVLAVLKEGCDG
ncbi:MAG: hypothetical protein J2P36_30270 [Ktedonobacteraceae bacterium]|nr:hypothetical protein [Ktedonobacteraceae bacterium]